MAHQLRRDDYTVGWVCALPVELAAAQEMLDEEHPDLEHDPNDNDENLYALGSIGGHNVVIVCLPAGRIGNNPAAVVATQMRATFKGLRFGLMVGIGGGVPSVEADVRLGDVVVSQPDKTFGGVVQYDSGKATPTGFDRTGLLNAPPLILLEAVVRVRANELRGRSKTAEYIAKLSRIPKFQRSKAGPDVLFNATYDHEGGPTCDMCSVDRQEPKQPRDSEEEFATHYGTIASGNQVIKYAAERDKLSAALGGILCFEMEAAGLMNTFPCLVIRGICDYADSHKNKRWQPYAAGNAAAYAKELLSVIPPADVAETRTAEKAMQTASRTAIYAIPFLKNLSFVGRHAELDILKQKLIVGRTCRKISIVGLGGVGKTQVALQFAYTVKETWSEHSIFWISAVSMEVFEQACASIVAALKIGQVGAGEDDTKELLRNYLSSDRAPPWLLVLDNADDPDLVFGTEQLPGILDYLPESDKGITLFTTRTQEVAVSLTRGDVLELGSMSRGDATEFLKASVINSSLVQDGEAAGELLDELACLPLAIVQAASYLNMNRTTIVKYLRLLRNTEKDTVSLMSKEFRDHTRYKGSANAIASTWVVSFKQLQERDPMAAKLLEFMSCVEWKAIPRSLLPQVQPEEQLEQAIGTLCGYSFVSRQDEIILEETEGKEEWYDLHRLVHLATRIWVRKYGDVARVAQSAMKHVAEVFPRDVFADQAIWRAYMPHALRLLALKQSCNIADRACLILRVGLCLQFDGRTREATVWLEQCCRLREVLREDHPDRLASQHALAIIYQADGQVKKAIKLLEGIVAIKAVLAEDHPSRLASQRALARAYSANGQVKEAVELLENVAAIQAVLAEDHPDRLVSQHALAIIYQANGQVKKAIKLLEGIVAIKAVLAEDHPSRLASQQALAIAYHTSGQVKKAIELLESIVAIKAVLAEDHPSRLASQHELAVIYQANGQVKEAIELLKSVVAIRAEVLGEDHPDRLLSIEALEYVRRAEL